MRGLSWPQSLVLGCLSGAGLALYVVAWHSGWSAGYSSVVAALLTVGSAAIVGVLGKGRSTSPWRAVTFLGCAFALSLMVLAVFRHGSDPAWAKHIPAVAGGDGILWQVQTTFLSVGFAGLAIAAQLFAEAPLAIGASRGRVLVYVWAGWFVGVGLVANVLIGIESIWLPSDLGVLAVAVFWFVPTLVLLVVSTIRLMRLFGHPSLLDEVVRLALVETLASRLDEVSRRYSEARSQLEELIRSDVSIGSLEPSAVTLRVQVPRVGLVIKAVKPQLVRRAIASLAPRATEGVAGDTTVGDLYTPAQISLDVEPGDRTRLGETAFRVSTVKELDRAGRDQLVRLFQSSIEFEPPGFVTPDEETDREITNVKDTISTSLRSGAFGTAERALELLGHVILSVWTARPESLSSSRRSSFTRRDWLYRSIGEAEQDVLLSHRAAGLFIDQAMTRALESPRTGSTEYVDECLRSFTRLWSDILLYGGGEFDSLPPRITICVQNLAAYSFSTSDKREDLEARATWAMVELVKLALDARSPKAARLAAEELNGLFEYSDRGGRGRAHVRAGQLVLSGWLDYLAAKGDPRNPVDAQLRALVTPAGTWDEVLSARDLAERGAAPFSRWDWWEMTSTNSRHAQLLELSHYIDRAELSALASSHGTLPPATDQEAASEYRRFMQLLDEDGRQLSPMETRLRQRFSEEVSKWDAAENDRLAQEPLSRNKIAALETALRENLNTRERLAAQILTINDPPQVADQSKPILGMNFRVPRHYLVDEVFNQTYADPKDLGEMIARGFTEGEDQKIVGTLRSQQPDLLDPTAEKIRQHIDALGDDSTHYVLVTPYGGLMDIEGWYSGEFRQALSRVTHVETAALDNEAFLFDRRVALSSCRRPEEKKGLTPVEGTSVALGVFEDVQTSRDPQVRIETGEFFVVWASDASGVHRFAPPARGVAGEEE